MSLTVTKRLAKLETDYWSKAKLIGVPGYEEYWSFFFAVYPVSIPVVNKFYQENETARQLDRQSEALSNSLAPINPAFMKIEDKFFRQMQWALHTSAEFRRITEAYWSICYEYLKAHYDVEKPDLFTVALRFWSDDIDRWQAQAEYIGIEPESREQYATDQIDIWRRVRKICDEEGESRNDKENRERWDRVFIERSREIYGRETTEEELDFERQVWAELREDMEAEKPASESEAARYLRDIETRYPRKG